MSGLADTMEYTHEVYDTARATLKLSSGLVEILSVTSPDEFVTDRIITEAEYAKIRDCLRQMTDCAAMSSSPGWLERNFSHRISAADGKMIRIEPTP